MSRLRELAEGNYYNVTLSTAAGQRLQDHARVLERQPEQAAHLRVPGAHVRRLQRDDAEPVHGGVVAVTVAAVVYGAATTGVEYIQLI